MPGEHESPMRATTPFGLNVEAVLRRPLVDFFADRERTMEAIGQAPLLMKLVLELYDTAMEAIVLVADTIKQNPAD